MNLNGDKILPGRTPKRLEKLAACKIAHMLIKKCLPALIQYWGADYKQWSSEVYMDRADNDMADEDGSDDESNGSEVSQTRRQVQTVPQNQAQTSQEQIQERVVPSCRGKNWCPNIFCNSHDDPADQDEIIVTVPLMQQEPEGAANVVEDCQTPQDEKSDALRHIDVAVSLMQRGLEALTHDDNAADDDDDYDGSDSEDTCSHASHLPRRVTSTDSSGSGRAHSVDDANTSQDPEQTEYLNQTENLWVQILSYKYLLQHLRKVKRWYDREVSFDNGGSALHWLVGEALTDVLDCQISPFVCTPFFRFTLQVMFSHEAGSLGQKNLDKVPGVKICKAYANFLKRLKPFGLRTLCTVAVEFAHPAPISVVIKNSKYLRKLVVDADESKPSLKCIKKHCKDIRDISLLTSNPFKQTSLNESFLFLIFFNGMSLDELMHDAEEKRKIPLSFPNLQSFRLFFGSTDYHVFLFCLQNFYPGIKTEFMHALNEEDLTPGLLRAKLQIPLLLEGYGPCCWDSIVFMQVQPRFSSNEREENDQYPKVRSVSLWNHYYLTGMPNSLVEELVTKYGCTSVVFRMPLIYLDNEEQIFSPHVITIGDRLTELTLSAGRTAFHASELVLGLNACPNLRLFALEVACFWPVTEEEIEELKPFPALKFLSISANVLIDPDIDYELEALQLTRLLGNLIIKAPSLSILEFMKTPCLCLVHIMNEIDDRTNINTLVIDCSFVRDIVYRLGSIVDSLPNLSYLLLYRASTELFVETKKIFQWSGLQVGYRCSKLVGVEDYQ